MIIKIKITWKAYFIWPKIQGRLCQICGVELFNKHLLNLDIWPDTTLSNRTKRHIKKSSSCLFPADRETKIICFMLFSNVYVLLKTNMWIIFILISYSLKWKPNLIVFLCITFIPPFLLFYLWPLNIASLELSACLSIAFFLSSNKNSLHSP